MTKYLQESGSPNGYLLEDGSGVYLLEDIIEQEGYRWRSDDGSEITASWLAAQDTNVTRPLLFNTRLRVILDTTTDLASTQYRLDYKKSTDSVYVPVLLAAPGVPAFQAQGADASGTADVTPVWPAHQKDDIGLLIIESCGGQAANLSTPAGFVAVTSPISVGATTAGTRLTVYWCRATSSAMASPTIADPGDHVYSAILTWRGCIAEGDPWDVIATDSKAVASTASTAPSVTTTVPNTLVLNILSRDTDQSASQYSAQANAVLGTFIKRTDRGTAFGNGGGIVVFQGAKATPGATGITTATVVSSTETMLTMALRPQPAPILMAASSNIAASGAATTAQLTPPDSRSGADFVSGRIQDDENPADAVTLTANHWTAFEWCVIAQSPAANGDVYQFRVTAAGVALSTYTVTPQWTIAASTLLVVAEALHAHAAESPVLSFTNVLAIADALHGLTSDTLSLVQANTLVLNDALHGHLADTLNLIQANALVVADTLHAHTAESFALSQAASLSVGDALHGHTADGLILVQAHMLNVNDASHAHRVANLAISSIQILAVQDALHAHTAGSVSLSQAHVLAVAAALHLHLADLIALTQESTLIVSDALHAHLAQTLSLRVPATFIDPALLFTVQTETHLYVVAPDTKLFTVH